MTRDRDGISTLVPQTSNFRGQVVIYRYILSGCLKNKQKTNQRQERKKRKNQAPVNEVVEQLLAGKIID